MSQAEVDFSSHRVREAVGGYTRERLARIRSWQTTINLSVLPLSAGHDTLGQLRELLHQAAPRRRPQ